MKHLPQLVLDLVALGGLAGMVYGVALIYPPAAWILGGLLATAGAAGVSRLLERRVRRREHERR